MELILAVAHLFKGDGSTAPERTIFQRALSCHKKGNAGKKVQFSPRNIEVLWRCVLLFMGQQQLGLCGNCVLQPPRDWCRPLEALPGGRAQQNTAQHGTVQYGATWPSAVQHSTEQYSTARHGTAQYSTAQCSTARHGTARHDAARHGGAPATLNLHRGSPASALPRIPIPIATEHLGGTAQ